MANNFNNDYSYTRFQFASATARTISPCHIYSSTDEDSTALYDRRKLLDAVQVDWGGIMLMGQLVNDYTDWIGVFNNIKECLNDLETQINNLSARITALENPQSTSIFLAADRSTTDIESGTSITINATISNGRGETTWNVSPTNHPHWQFSYNGTIGTAILSAEQPTGTVSYQQDSSGQTTSYGYVDFHGVYDPGSYTPEQLIVTAKNNSASSSITLKPARVIGQSEGTWSIGFSAPSSVPAGLSIDVNGKNARLENTNTTEKSITISLTNNGIRLNRVVNVPGKSSSTPTTTYYFSVGISQVTSSNYTTVNNVTTSIPSSFTYTNNSGNKAAIYILAPSNKTITVEDKSLRSPYEISEVSTSISNHKVYVTTARIANGGGIIVNLN